jgi:superfamily II DNA/RNA helicase
LVLTPTRELAQQIFTEFQKFGKGLKISCVYGGVKNNEKELKDNCQILVATPGRLNELIEQDLMSVGNVSYLTFDEADRMLDMGFEPVNQPLLIFSKLEKLSKRFHQKDKL